MIFVTEGNAQKPDGAEPTDVIWWSFFPSEGATIRDPKNLGRVNKYLAI